MKSTTLRNAKSFVKNAGLYECNSIIDLCSQSIKQLKKTLKNNVDIDRNDIYSQISKLSKKITYTSLIKDEINGKCILHELAIKPHYFNENAFLSQKKLIFKISKVFFENLYIICHLKSRSKYCCLKILNIENDSFGGFYVIWYDVITQEESKIHSDMLNENIIFNIEKINIETMIFHINQRFTKNIEEAKLTINLVYELNELQKTYQLQKNLLLNNFVKKTSIN